MRIDIIDNGSTITIESTDENLINRLALFMGAASDLYERAECKVLSDKAKEYHNQIERQMKQKTFELLNKNGDVLATVKSECKPTAMEFADRFHINDDIRTLEVLEVV